ncbi:N-acetyl sugar amidotransferase [Aestuariispira ectoiniformans]|uniref:N-acetyl sugar amidotransferase n=1 Tax=Aestuariispira ectoiniformans TaxID=2775080 RepID=UPI00223B5ADD|nr:N-acetyl sugar amidotransferase [Aestuariispira ectoiniformans]
MLNLCTSCLYPETKPDLVFDESGVCSACNNFQQRKAVDWDKRKQELVEIAERYRSKDGSNYDCVVPVSGGKDSTYQVIRILELGLNPLCVTATTDSPSELGRRNIENIKRLGVDYIEVSVNPVVRRKLNQLCLEEIGDISWPEHVTIFTLPVRIAVQMGIPLIVWGENPQNEYGGPAAAASGQTLTRRWLEEFGGLLGLRVSDWVGRHGIEAKHLIQYSYPSNEELERVGVTGIFLGHYVPWDGMQNAIIAQAHGFEYYPHLVEGSLASYENLDNYQTGIHDYFKYLKFGFGRATDIACNHIRRGRLLREDALKLVEMHDGQFPWTCLGKPIEEILAEIDMTLDDFLVVCDRFTNRKIFQTDNEGNIIRDEDGNPIKRH